MINILLLVLAVFSTSASFSSLELFQKNKMESKDNGFNSEMNAIVNSGHEYPNSLNEISIMLHQEAYNLPKPVITKVLTSLNCAQEHSVAHNNILTVIDYSLPSSEKRLWVFDLKEKKLLFHTYVAHGIKSGTLFSNYFSNKYDSKASSLGVYKTEKAYYGREGLSLRLGGLEYSFNDNASNRSVVMHGGWYVDEQFIKKYGRAGRSWGCPAVPLSLYQPIINTIKENSLMVVYYPSDVWLGKSRFLNCDTNFPTQKINTLLTEAKPLVEENEQRESILFADFKKNSVFQDNDPIVVMTADHYQRTYHNKPPLERMLRRQINHVEYIALSNTEFSTLALNTSKDSREALNGVYFVVPEIVMVRGYYETLMKIVNLGKIKEIRFNAEPSNQIQQVKSYNVYFETRSFINFKATNRFIRWVGL